MMSFEPRDSLEHMLIEVDYCGVDFELVWDLVRNRIPELRRQIASILDS